MNQFRYDMEREERRAHRWTLVIGLLVIVVFATAVLMLAAQARGQDSLRVVWQTNSPSGWQDSYLWAGVNPAWAQQRFFKPLVTSNTLTIFHATNIHGPWTNLWSDTNSGGQWRLAIRK